MNWILLYISMHPRPIPLPDSCGSLRGCLFRMTEFVQHVQHFLQLGIIAHVLGVMRETDASFFVHNHQGRHPSEFQQFDLLLVQIRDFVAAVG